MAEADRIAEDEGLKESIRRYAIELGDVAQKAYVKEMEAPVDFFIIYKTGMGVLIWRGQKASH